MFLNKEISIIEKNILLFFSFAKKFAVLHPSRRQGKKGLSNLLYNIIPHLVSISIRSSPNCVRLIPSQSKRGTGPPEERRWSYNFWQGLFFIFSQHTAVLGRIHSP